MHFVRCPDGKVYSPGVAVYAWWHEYLRVFDDVLIVARVRSVKEMYPPERVAEGSGVTFYDLPDFRGPQQYFQQARAVKSALSRAIDQADAFLFRVPGTVGYLAARELVRRGKPYGYEVVGDPHDVFSAGSVRHLLRTFFRHWHVHNLKRFCNAACAVSYVTEQALQRRYPPNLTAFTTHFSDVGLKPEAFAAGVRNVANHSGTHRLLFVGTLEQLYKAPDVLINAVAMCRNQGINITLTLAGEGAKRKSLESLVSKLHLTDSIRFAGHIASRQELIAMLDESDLFVLPSRAEGLPRAMLEAMARAVPCIGSSVNGIPELLAAEDLVPPGDVKALAAKMSEVLLNPARMSRMSACGLTKAHEFELNDMRARKTAFLQYLRDASAFKVHASVKTVPTEV